MEMVFRRKLVRIRAIIIAAFVVLAGGGIPAGILLSDSPAQATATQKAAPAAVVAPVDLQSGALFVENNYREGNEVTAFARHADGTLTKVGTFPTGGGGSGSFEDSSNALVLASPDDEVAPNNFGGKPEFLFATDAGTSDIAVFKVEPTKLVLVGNYPSNGQTPVSLTVSHGLLYVLNSGKYDNREFDPKGNALENCASGYSEVAATGAEFANGDQHATPSITGFVVDSSGKLTHIPGSTRTLSGDSLSGCAQVSFNPSGKTVVVSERLAKLPGYQGNKAGVLNTFQVNQDGTLSNHRLITPTGIAPFGFTFTKNGTLLTTEQQGGYYGPGTSSVASYSVNDGNGNLTATSPSVHTGRTDTCWVVATADGKYAYTSSAFDNGPITLLKLGAHGLTGQFDPVASSPNDDPTTDHLTDGSTDISLSSDSHYLYSLNSFQGFVSVFRLNADGTLAFVQRVQAFHLLTFGLGGEASPLGIAAF
jgi:6-phosphogluconolactonase (cycloisomerase 2 family)